MQAVVVPLLEPPHPSDDHIIGMASTSSSLARPTLGWLTMSKLPSQEMELQRLDGVLLDTLIVVKSQPPRRRLLQSCTASLDHGLFIAALLVMASRIRGSHDGPHDGPHAGPHDGPRDTSHHSVHVAAVAVLRDRRHRGGD